MHMRVKVLRAERWSMDVERLSDGRCFRISGIAARESGILEQCCDDACARARYEVAEWDRPHTDAASCALCGSPIGAGR